MVRTLLRVAGLPWRIGWYAEGEPVDVYYGPAPFPDAARVAIRWKGKRLADCAEAEPDALRETDVAPTLDFGAGGDARRTVEGLRFDADIIYACYWLLAGARERTYGRDRWDNLDLGDGAMRRLRLLERPLVSLYATLLRRIFTDAGYAALALPWATNGHSAALAITHDVDYPQMLRGIETVRLLAARGLGAARLIGDVWRGRSHFWQFQAWLDFAASLGGRPAFYFMARRGSLLQYALGTPDAFYEIDSPPFRSLFEQLRAVGAEIGLHASFHAHRAAAQLAREKNRIEDVARVEVAGNRHHYWHLDPDDPAETLRRHESIGMRYDSSLAFEFYPGFRRGVCHPFRPFDPRQRRELRLLELPPTWMDDHFDRRLEKNGIEDPDAAAAKLLAAVRDTAGIAVLDYHVRGMNEDFFPRYGRWLRDFCARHVDSSIQCATPRSLVEQYESYEATLAAASVDALSTDRSAALTIEPT